MVKVDWGAPEAGDGLGGVRDRCAGVAWRWR